MPGEDREPDPDADAAEAAPGGTTAITRTSMISGVARTLELPVTREELEASEGGLTIQEACPHLSPGEREFHLDRDYRRGMDGMVGGNGKSLMAPGWQRRLRSHRRTKLWGSAISISTLVERSWRLLALGRSRSLPIGERPLVIATLPIIRPKTAVRTLPGRHRRFPFAGYA